MSTNSECMLNTSAGTRELQLPLRETAPSSPRVTRSPLGRSTTENVGGVPIDTSKSGSSPARRRISAFTSSPKTPKIATPALKTPNPVRPTYSSPESSPSKVSAADLSLQKQCAELYAHLSTVTAEYKHLENELMAKNILVDELTQKMLANDRLVRVMEDERRKTAELHSQEMRFYKDSLEELQRQNSRISKKFEQDSLLAEAVSSEHEGKYTKLVKSYKALQSNFELERNSKALLIDQIEYLTKERDFLLSNANVSPTEDLHHSQCQNSDQSSDQISDHQHDSSFGLPKSLIHQNSGADLHANSVNNSSSDSDSDGSVHGTHLLSSYADLTNNHNFHASSPIKNHSSSSLDLSPDFQFPTSNPIQHAPSLEQPEEITRSFSPPNSEEKAKSLKRQSLPAQLKMNANLEDDFVLSPLKLTPHPNSYYFDTESSNTSTNTRPNSTVKNRYSGTRSNHSRYNSHDILPIKVEFESLNRQLRSTSAPDRDQLQQLSSVAEIGNPIQDSDMAFMKLNGFSIPSKRDSLMTNSSKRSSFLSDINVSTGDVTKQEITKLKFELQSLKLHNEKLLSYIGFELQKQKKNIKKLSSKQSLRPKPTSQKMEYSDAKLIEKSKEMLIHKKRVLRSVSINPILSTKYGGSQNGGMFQPIVGLGVLNTPTEDEDDFEFKSHFISSLKKDDCDDYGFLTHRSKYNSRVLSKNNQEYSEHSDQQTIKKYKSQTFGNPREHAVLDLSSAEESFVSIDEEPDDGFTEFGKDANIYGIDDLDDLDDIDEVDNIDELEERYLTTSESSEEWESGSEKSNGSDVDYDKLNRFNQMRYLILGKEHLKKSKHSESISDENLKYKFLTIALGIVIVGIKFTTHPPHQLTGS